MIGRIQFQSQQMIWISLVALAATMLTIWYLYRPQLRGLPRRWSWILGLARLGALGALSLSLLRPVIHTPLPSDGPRGGTVVILIDRSKSMNVVDNGRTPAELVQLSAAMGILPEQARPSQLSDLRQRVSDLIPLADQISRARSELEYARLSGRGIDAAGAHLRETRAALAAGVKRVAAAASDASLHDDIAAIGGDSAGLQIDKILSRIDSDQTGLDQQLYQSNEGVRRACDELSRQPRLELVRRALLGESGLIERLAANWKIRLFSFAGELSPLNEAVADMDADGTATDLAGAIRDLPGALSPLQADAIVVFSDGREAGVRPSSPPFSMPDLPVISLNPAVPPKTEISIASVVVPPSVYINEPIAPRVELRATGLNGTTVQVELQADGQRRMAVGSIEHDAASVQLEAVPMHHAGPQPITLSVEPIPGELATANNRVQRIVKVVSEKTRVAIFGGLATRDYQFLRNALSHEPGLSLTQQLVGAQRCSLEPERLLEQDVLILSDVPLDALDARQWEAVNRMVNERGGSVIVVVSDPSIPAQYATHPLAASLLPWHGGETPPAWRSWPGQDPVFRIVPAEPDFPDWLKLSPDSDLDRRLWDQFQPVFRVLAAPALRSGIRPLLIERDSALPVFSETRQGAGRVLFLTLGEMWRWRSQLQIPHQADVGDAPDQIWRQILSHAAREPYAVSDGVLLLDADRLQLEPAETVRVRARIRSDVPSFPGGSITLTLERDGIVVHEENLTPMPGSADEYVTTVSPGTPGDYRLRLSADEHEVLLPLQVLVSDEAEMRDVSPDPSELSRVTGSRGQVLSLNDWPSVPKRLAKLREATEPRLSEYRLWDSPYLFLFVIGCLGLEWSVRRRVGLA